MGSQGGNGSKFFQNHRDGDTRPSGRLTQQGIIDTTTGSDDHQLVRNGVNNPKAPGLGRSKNTDQTRPVSGSRRREVHALVVESQNIDPASDNNGGVYGGAAKVKSKDGRHGRGRSRSQVGGMRRRRPYGLQSPTGSHLSG